MTISESCKVCPAYNLCPKSVGRTSFNCTQFHSAMELNFTTDNKQSFQSLCESCTKPNCDVNFHDWEVRVSECSKWGNK